MLLIWVYYSAQILFFGAELTQVYANQYGTHVRPTPNAERIPAGRAGGRPVSASPRLSQP